MIAQAHILWQRIQGRVLYGPAPRGIRQESAGATLPVDPVEDWARRLGACGGRTVLDVTRVGHTVRMHVADMRQGREMILTYHVDPVGTLYVDPADFYADVPVGAAHSSAA